MKASVLIISYNHEKYIRQAIESVLMQKYCGEFEIILCDDCSTDNTVAVAKDMLQNVTNAEICVNEKNLGITKNYQRAFSLCKGEYVFVLEGDDYWTDVFKIKTQVELLDNYPDYTFCSHYYFTKKAGVNSLIKPVLQSAEQFTVFECKNIILDPFIGNNFSTCCYRRSALEKISPETYNVTCYEWMINISVSRFGLTAVINKPMSVYRISDLGSWNKYSEKEQLLKLINIMPDYDKVLDYKYHNYFEQKKLMLQQQLQLLETNEQKTSEAKSFKNFLQKILKRF